MVVYASLISTSFPVGALATRSLDPVLLTFLRFALASVLFGSVLAYQGRLRWVGGRALLRYAIVSASIVVFFVLMFESLRWTDPVSTSALFTVVPLVSAGTGLVLLGKRTRIPELIVLVIGAAGAAWVVFDGELAGVMTLRLDRGERLFLLATLSYAAYVPLIKRLHRDESTLEMTFWILAVGTVLLGSLGPASDLHLVGRTPAGLRVRDLPGRVPDGHHLRHRPVCGPPAARDPRDGLYLPDPFVRRAARRTRRLGVAFVVGDPRRGGDPVRDASAPAPPTGAIPRVEIAGAGRV